MMKIQRNEVHLWFVNDQEVIDEDLLDSYQSLLSPTEIQRWQRFKFPEHRRQYLLTRALVRSVLAEYMGVNNPAGLCFESNEYGKPALTDFDSPVAFNLSHTKGLIVLAVTLGGDLGVDIEKSSRKAEVLKLAKRYFSPQEVVDMEALGPEQHYRRFFDLWTLKESYIKACGKGLAIPLDSFSFSLTDSPISISFAPELDDFPEDWKFWQFDVNKDYRLALALKQRGSAENKLICKTGVPLQGFEGYSPLLIDSNS